MRSKGRQCFGGQGKAFGIHLKCGIIPLSALPSRRLVPCYLSCLTIQLGDLSPGPNPDSSSPCLRGKDLRLFLLIQSRCSLLPAAETHLLREARPTLLQFALVTVLFPGPQPSGFQVCV